jgi:hypothetical protein
MKKFYVVFTILLSGLLAAGSAFAQGRAQFGLEGEAAHSAGDLLGLPVQDLQGEQLGLLEDIIVDLDQNQIAYGVIGMEGTSRVVPWAAITSDHEGAFLTLQADRQTVMTAPRPPSPGQLDQEFGQQIHEHFGVSPYWEEGGAEPGMIYPDGVHPEGFPLDGTQRP